MAEGEKAVAHFRCSGTHLGQWRGHPPNGQRFHDVDEIYIFGVGNGKLAAHSEWRTAWRECVGSGLRG